MFWSPFTTWGWSSCTPRHQVQILVAFYDLGVVQLYSQAPGTSSGRLLRPAWAADGLIFPGHHIRKADHSPPSNTDVKSEPSNTASCLYTLYDVYRTTLPSWAPRDGAKNEYGTCICVKPLTQNRRVLGRWEEEGWKVKLRVYLTLQSVVVTFGTPTVL